MKAGKGMNAIFVRRSAIQTALERELVSKEPVLVTWVTPGFLVKSLNVLSCVLAEEPTLRASVTARLASKVLSVNSLLMSVIPLTVLTTEFVFLANVLVSLDSKAQDVRKQTVWILPVEEAKEYVWMASVSVGKDGEETTAHNHMK